MSYNKLMIVTHPDDETIFGGAQLIQEKGWMVICMTNGDNKVRRKEFIKVMKKVDAEFEIWEYADKWDGDFDRIRLKTDLAELLERQPLDKVVTHNLKGEYGHTQHKVLSKLVHELVNKNIYVFGTSKKKLDNDLLKKKKKLLKCYKSQDIKAFKKYAHFEKIKQVR
ncbi:PIG-L family deacetylase [Paenibacillus psychroresistens]|uniref:PIG-L family deacetylase n=1 Tax=Paenibacillus psychroresistens TaxID=1778678 RepID=A0A6B8RPA5_9BACL|nr:PIG-L family deacetylase [Paenibacillus psychroresistens]QGQ97522.1 PIG-L family deacetylase [Paenibacillus psychroresistens]